MFATFEPSSQRRGATARHPLTRLVEAVLLDGEGNERAVRSSLTALLPLIPKAHREGAAVVLYQPGRRRLLVSRTNGTFLENLVAAMRAARHHARFGEFEIPGRARIQIDFFGIERPPIDARRLSVGTLDNSRFEFGVDGLRITADDKRHYFLPGDSYVRSIYDLNQLRRYLLRLTGGADLRRCGFERIRSTSVVSFEGRWLRLYRGHPVRTRVRVEDVETACDRAIAHVLAERREDGRFLYYYDAAGDTERDHEHPKRDPARNPYYNELRHCGGIVTLLLDHRRSGRAGLRPAIDAAIGFLIENSVPYETPEGRQARYVYYNRKSKLGGSGLSLYVLALYQDTFDDDRYAGYAHEFFEHLMNQVTASGEFIYYNIYLDEPITEERNADYFSFYYPGEAVVGLATYLKWVGAHGGRRAAAEETIRRAMRFLLVERPRTRAAHYTTLPSDAWLMAAINELWEMPAFRDPSYADFVFQDADRMVSLMYDEKTALFPDYVGAFHYTHGDLPYADGARCEGLVAALALAMTLGEAERVRRYATALVKTVRATLLLANTPESLYFAPNPGKALGGIRFKLTRQWFRIDTIQHVVCYYFRFLDLYRRLRRDGTALDDTLAEEEAMARETV